HHDRHALEAGIGAQLPQRLEAIHARHFQVEQDDGGSSVRVVFKLPAMEQVIEHFDAVAHHDNLVGEVVFLQRAQRQLDIVSIVLSEQYSFQWTHAFVFVWAKKNTTWRPGRFWPRPRSGRRGVE